MRTPHCCAAGSKPGAPTRSACICSTLGHPLVGDPAYGKRNSTIPFSRQALHAERLGLLHPQTGKQMNWHAEPPADLQELIEKLRGEAAVAHSSLVTRQSSRR